MTFGSTRPRGVMAATRFHKDNKIGNMYQKSSALLMIVRCCVLQSNALTPPTPPLALVAVVAAAVVPVNPGLTFADDTCGETRPRTVPYDEDEGGEADVKDGCSVAVLAVDAAAAFREKPPAVVE